MTDPVSHEDFVALERFYARQAQAIDLGDPVGWADSFTADGSFTSPTANGRIKGREELSRFAAQYAERRDDAPQLRHWLNHLEAYDEPDGSVTAISYGMLIAIDRGEAPRILRSSIHRDRLVRTDDGFKVASRLIEPDAAPAANGRDSTERGVADAIRPTR
jgi:SnoaL-like protein